MKKLGLVTILTVLSGCEQTLEQSGASRVQQAHSKCIISAFTAEGIEIRRNILLLNPDFEEDIERDMQNPAHRNPRYREYMHLCMRSEGFLFEEPLISDLDGSAAASMCWPRPDDTKAPVSDVNNHRCWRD